jgi:hypothetical protein
MNRIGKFALAAAIAFAGCGVRDGQGAAPSPISTPAALTSTQAIVAQASAAAAAQRASRDCHADHVERVQAIATTPKMVNELAELAAGRASTGAALCPALAQWVIDELEIHGERLGADERTRTDIEAMRAWAGASAPENVRQMLLRVLGRCAERNTTGATAP